MRSTDSEQIRGGEIGDMGEDLQGATLDAMDRAYAELNERAGPLDDAAYTNFGYIAAGWWPRLRTALQREQPGWRTMDTLYFCDRWGEVTDWHCGADGVVFSCSSDELPDSLAEDAPKGWSVFDGTKAPLTAEDFADEDHPVHSCGVPCGVGDEFWRGSLRSATPAEVVAFFFPSLPEAR